MNTCYNPYSLHGKRILVTGASSGIGQATAIECSRLGATVIVTGRNEERLKATYEQLDGQGHAMIVADLTDEESVKSLVKGIEVLDGVVLCAGISSSAPVKFATKNKFKETFATNFFATAELLRLLIKGKKISKESSVVAISSIGGNYCFTLGNGIYGASKAALSSWMKSVALELATKKIRVNCVCPGMTHTAMTATGIFTEEQLAEDEAKYPLGRWGNPEEIAWAVIYLLSDAAKWITGTDIVIDGGSSI